MTDIKQYLPYCVGKKATISKINVIYKYQSTHRHFELGGTYWVSYELLHIVQLYDLTIIPHMRKLSSLTEEEARELVVLHFGESYREELTKEHYYKDELRKPQLEFVSIVGYMVHYRAWGRSNEFGLLTKYNFEQFHYLTSIGIAWWATEDIWESGAIIEIND